MGDGGIMNGTPTPGHTTMVLPLLTSNASGVGVPFIIPSAHCLFAWGTNERGLSTRIIISAKEKTRHMP
jgi:hypothetical protein